MCAVLEEKCCDAFELRVVEEPVSALAGSGKIERCPALLRLPVDVRAVIEQPLHQQQRAVAGHLMQHRQAVGRAHLRQLGVLIEDGDHRLFAAGLIGLLEFAHGFGRDR